MKIFHLALSHIRKSKSAAVSLFLFIFIASVLLNIGLMVITQLNPFLDEKNEELQDPHATFVMNRELYRPDIGTYLSDRPGVTNTEKEDVISMDIANFTYGDGDLASTIVILNADAPRDIGAMKLIEKKGDKSDDAIFVPLSFKTNGGYSLGDDLAITYRGDEYRYRIAGFFETTVMGTTNMGVMKLMLPRASFKELSEQLGGKADGIMLSARMNDSADAPDLAQNVMQQFNESASSVLQRDFETVKNVSLLTITIIATLLVAFAAINVLVSLIVIRFRVSNSIEDGMENIGVLKAIGYTSAQILASIALQFLLIVVGASLVGVALSYTLMPFFGETISSLSGLVWDQHIALGVNGISIVVIVLTVCLVTLLSAARIRKISPVDALRGGVTTHSFKRNHVSLERSKMGLTFSLAMKSMLAHAKQNIMVLGIVVALTFATVFSTVLYYNIASDQTAFLDIFGSEPANVMFTVDPDADTSEVARSIREMDHVRKVNLFDLIETKVDGQTVYTNVTNRYDELENDVVYEGRQPQHENEISISWVISDQIGKTIGDTVEVEYGGKSARYLITGLSQSIGNLGQVGALTLDGMKEMHPDYQGSTLFVYLDGVENKPFIRSVQDTLGDQIVDPLDIDENIKSQTGMYTAAIFAVMLMVLAITVLVVVMILYLVIKTLIIKRKTEFGVMKAIGYSTFQIMNQISLGFLPVIAGGVAIGGVIGYFFTNPMLSVLLSGAGVKRLAFNVEPFVILLPCVGILIVAYVVSMLVARRIRKISAYGLMTE